MVKPSLAIAVVLGILLLGPGAAELAAQADQGEAARMLREGNGMERARAVLFAHHELDPQEIGPELRRALIAEFERWNRAYHESLLAWERGDPGARWEEDDVDLHSALLRMVAAFDDPAAIPALAGAYTAGGLVRQALVEFGEPAVPALLEVVRSPRSHRGQVSGGLMILRVMVETYGAEGLSPETMAELRSVARDRLTGPQGDIVLWRAIDLAIALDDPDLRGIVEELASDPDAVRARGVTDPDLVERTRRQAADRLAGVPALPRR